MAPTSQSGVTLPLVVPLSVQFIQIAEMELSMVSCMTLLASVSPFLLHKLMTNKHNRVSHTVQSPFKLLRLSFILFHLQNTPVLFPLLLLHHRLNFTGIDSTLPPLSSLFCHEELSLLPVSDCYFFVIPVDDLKQNLLSPSYLSSPLPSPSSSFG
jgi:hypothetical protein